jgi:uncharacterized protein YoxC
MSTYLIAVLIINLLISLLCFYIAWKVWQVKLVLDRVEKTLKVMERATYNFLSQAPQVLGQREKNLQQLRKQYRELELRWQKLQQILKILSFGGTLWRRH